MQQLLYIRRYKITNLANVLIFMAIVATVSILYGKTQMLQLQADGSVTDRVRLGQHEADLTEAQRTITRLTGEIQFLRQEVEQQLAANKRLSEDLERAINKLNATPKAPL